MRSLSEIVVKATKLSVPSGGV